MNDEYRVVNSEDEFEKYKQLIMEGEVEEELNEYLIKAFGSTYNSELQEKVKQVYNQQGLSLKDESWKDHKSIKG